MFMTEGGDLGYRVIRTSGNKEEEVAALTRVPSNKGIQSGHMICQPSPWTYTVIFDNSYSVIRGKTVFFRYEVKEAKSDGMLKGLIGDDNILTD